VTAAGADGVFERGQQRAAALDAAFSGFATVDALLAWLEAQLALTPAPAVVTPPCRPPRWTPTPWTGETTLRGEPGAIVQYFSTGAGDAPSAPRACASCGGITRYPRIRCAWCDRPFALA
jgi:hypothetical protein